jgi:hypothetical protein
MSKRHDEINPTARAAAGGPPASGSGSPEAAVSTAMEKIAAFVPTEVIGLYVSGLGILAPTSDAGKWLLFCVCALMIPLIMWIGFRDNQQKNLPAPSARIALILFGLAVVAFVAWASALPSTPFISLVGERAHLYGGFAVIVLSILMPKIASLLRVANL